MGKFQDGALRHNNPISIALWECDRIWPRETPKDVVLSLGTGRTAIVTTPQAVSPDHTVNSKFIPRLCRSFLTGLDGEMAWRQLLNHVGRDDEKRYFRLNVDLAGPEPRLDDLRAMEQLSREVVTRGHAKLQRCGWSRHLLRPRSNTKWYIFNDGVSHIAGGTDDRMLAIFTLEEVWK